MGVETYHKHVTTGKHWSADAVEAAIRAQGIDLAAGRAERLALGQAALLAASAADPLLAALEFDTDPPAFAEAVSKCR
jgi:hypothetical protein